MGSGRLAVCVGLLNLCGTALVGCGGSASLSFRGTIPAENRQKVEGSIEPGRSLTFPSDRPFNVHDKLSAQTPGPDGTARGEARADEAGRADATASGENGGTAWGRFQIGHCLDNRSGKPLRVDVAFVVEYELAAECKAPAAANNGNSPRASDPLEAAVALRVMVKDSAERILREMVLADVSNDTGYIGKDGKERPHFSIDMEPDLAYTLAVTGEARVAAGSDSSANATAAIKHLTITVTGKEN